MSHRCMVPQCDGRVSNPYHKLCEECGEKLLKDKKCKFCKKEKTYYTSKYGKTLTCCDSRRCLIAALVYEKNKVGKVIKEKRDVIQREENTHRRKKQSEKDNLALRAELNLLRKKVKAQAEEIKILKNTEKEEGEWVPDERETQKDFFGNFIEEPKNNYTFPDFIPFQPQVNYPNVNGRYFSSDP